LYDKLIEDRKVKRSL